MLAVVKIAGQQFKVKAGDSLYVPHIEGKRGDKVEFSEVLMTDNAGTVSIGSNVKAIVKAEILLDLVQGDKVIAFKAERLLDHHLVGWRLHNAQHRRIAPDIAAG